MTAPLPTPDRIVEADGRVNLGWFASPFVHANLDDAPAKHLLAPLRNSPLATVERLARRMQLKQWIYLSVVTEKLLFACAVVDIGYIGSAFAYVVDRASGDKYEYSTLCPGAHGVTVAANSLSGVSCIEKAGFGRIVVLNDDGSGKRRVELALDGTLGKGSMGKGSKPPLRASIDILDPGDDPAPVVVVEQSEPGCFLYTHKNYGLPAQGHVSCGPIDDSFELGKGLAGFDYNRGYRPRETYWNWAAACGHSVAGERVGFNLTAHRPWEGAGANAHSGASHSKKADALDCALWLGSRCEKLTRVEFDYDPSDLMSSWHIHDDEGLVDLRFNPLGKRAEDVDFGVVVSQFHQPYGTFVGTLRDRDGRQHELSQVFGVTEQHFARW